MDDLRRTIVEQEAEIAYLMLQNQRLSDELSTLRNLIFQYHFIYQPATETLQ